MLVKYLCDQWHLQLFKMLFNLSYTGESYAN